MTGSRLLSMGSSLLRVWVISMNPGSQQRDQESYEGWCGLTSHGRVAGASTVAVAHIAVQAGWPSLWVADIDPLGQDLLCQVQLFLDSCGMVSVHHGMITSVQLDCTMVMKPSSSLKEMSCLIACQNSCSLLTRWWGWPETGGVHLLGPILQSSCVSDSMLQLAKTDVLGSEPCILWWQEAVLADQMVHWWWHIVILHFLHPVAWCRNPEGGVHLLGKFFAIYVTWDLCQLLPPRWSMKLFGMPLYPIRGMQGGGVASVAWHDGRSNW